MWFNRSDTVRRVNWETHAVAKSRRMVGSPCPSIQDTNASKVLPGAASLNPSARRVAR